MDIFGKIFVVLHGDKQIFVVLQIQLLRKNVAYEIYSSLQTPQLLQSKALHFTNRHKSQLHDYKPEYKRINLTTYY